MAFRRQISNYFSAIYYSIRISIARHEKKIQASADVFEKQRSKFLFSCQMKISLSAFAVEKFFCVSSSFRRKMFGVQILIDLESDQLVLYFFSKTENN